MASTAAVRSEVTTYAEDVVAGRTTAGRFVRLACERHLRDLKIGHERGLRFDPDAAERVFAFFERFLCLKDGEFAGRPFVLEPSQRFIVGSLFGWKHGDYRRFRTAYIEEGKGNGKTPMLAGIALYLLVGDGEQGAEVYSAAVTREQAGILFNDAKEMVRRSPALAARLNVNVSNIAFERLGGFFRPVSREAKSLDGKRVHGAMIDELHEHVSGEAVDKMRKGTKGRRQPLVCEITNSGHDQQSVCWEHHDYSAKVLERVFDDDEWLAYVCGLDPCDACRSDGVVFPKEGCPECDDWRDEAVWIKANPLLGVTIKSDYLRKEVRESEQMPSKRALTKRLNFCIWTEAKNPWLSTELWSAGGEPVDPAILKGRRCFGGLDLSSNFDLTAFALAFPPEEADGDWYALVRFWVPEENVLERVRRDHVPYDVWIERGLVRATPGNVVNYDFVEDDIRSLAGEYQIVSIGYDRWAAGQIYQHLGAEGLTMVPVGQGFASMAAPCKALERIVGAAKLRHGGNPVLAWNVANAVVETDPAGNQKPVKGDPNKRIDGLVALVMAVGEAIRDAPQGPSIYETRGLLVLGPAGLLETVWGEEEVP